MIDEKDCTVCRVQVNNEFQCKRCKCQLHYTCALGFDPPDDLKGSNARGDFMCAPCIVGTDYDLLHRALEAHRRCQPPQITQSEDGDDHVADTSAPVKSPRRRARRRRKSQQHLVVRKEAINVSRGESSDEGDHSSTADSDAANIQGDADSREEAASQAGSLRSVNLVDDDDDVTMCPINPACMTRSKRESYILNTIKNFPDHVDTLCGGDSMLHGVDGKVIDPEGSINVRSVGGLCVVAAVSALRRHDQCHRRIKRVIWYLGTNDFLHQSQHCLEVNEDKPNAQQQYLGLLDSECRRVFPEAVVTFILPFSGSDKVPESHIKQLSGDIKAACPRFNVCQPPSMRNKLSRDGVHLSRDGKRELVKFLQSKFAPPRAQRRNTQRGNVRNTRGGSDFRVTQPVSPVSIPQIRSYAEVARARNTSYQIPRVRLDSPPRNERGPVDIQQATVQQSHVQGYHYPVTPGFVSVPEHSHQNALSHGQIVKEISEALEYVMRLRRQGPQPPNYPRHSGL